MLTTCDSRLNDAEERTESWRLRHHVQTRHTLGAWRWGGLLDNIDLLLPHLIDRKVLDFGGADGGVGFGAEVIDVAHTDCHGRRIDSHDIDIDRTYDTIFTSHTLEHVRDLEWLLQRFHWVLRTRGKLIVHVPAWTCERWRSGQYSNPNQAETHYHTFSLTTDRADGESVVLDALLRVSGFQIDFAKPVRDNSYLILAERCSIPC